MTDQSDQFQSNKGFQEVERYLIGYFKTKGIDAIKEGILDKIKNKIAVKLGYGNFNQMIGLSFPGESLAQFARGWLVWATYETYYLANANRCLNPYDPSSQQDEYVGYLLYSWGRYLIDLWGNKDSGKKIYATGPGYIYFDVAAEAKRSNLGK